MILFQDFRFYSIILYVYSYASAMLLLITRALLWILKSERVSFPMLFKIVWAFQGPL